MGRMIDADALKERFRKEQMSMDEHGREFSSCFIGYGNNLSTAWDCVEDIVDSMPTINQWIPVTERLPEEDGDYLVTTSSLYGATIYVTTRNFSDGEWTYDRAVTAWMPLPKPYEGSEKSD